MSGIEEDIKGRFSGISEEQLDDLERSLVGGPEFYSDKMQKKLIAEIRRLRAENAELRASYERVEKYAAELSRQREEQADMIRTINPLYR